MENNGPITPNKGKQPQTTNNTEFFKNLIEGSSIKGSKDSANSYVGFDRISSQGVQSINKRYEDLAKEGKLAWGDVNPFSKNINLESKASDVQGAWNKMGNGAIGFAKLAGAGMLQSIGSSYDIKQGKDIFAGNTDASYKNWWDEVATSMRENAMEDNTIYGADDFNSFSYWANQFQQLGTTAGIAAHGLLEQALLSAVTSGSAGASAPLQAARMASTLKNINLAKQFAFGSLKGVTEAVMNSKETYDNVFNEYINREGVTYEEADTIAKEAATTHARIEATPLVLLNGLQWMTVGKFNPFLKGGAKNVNTGFGGAFETITDTVLPNVKSKIAKRAIDYGVNVVSESLEEGIQTGVGAYALYQQDKKHGGAEGKSLWGDYIFTHEMRDSMIGGALGGAVFKGMGDTMAMASRSRWFGQGENQNALYTNLTENLIAKGQADLKEIKQALVEGDPNKANRIRLRSNLNNIASALRIDTVKGDGSTTSFDAYVAQMENVLNSVNTNDTQALEELGISSNEDRAYIKESYGQMLQDANLYKNIYQNEVSSSISTDIAEEKTHYSMMQNLSKREIQKSESFIKKSSEEAVKSFGIEPENISNYELQMQIAGLEYYSNSLKEENPSLALKMEDTLTKKRKDLADMFESREILGQYKNDYTHLINADQSVLYQNDYVEAFRLQDNLGTYQELYGELSSTKGQRKRAENLLKDQINNVVKGKLNTSSVQVRNLLNQGKVNNVITKAQEEKLISIIFDQESELAKSAQTAETLSEINSQITEAENEAVDTIAQKEALEEQIELGIAEDPERLGDLDEGISELNTRISQLQEARQGIVPEPIVPEFEDQQQEFEDGDLSDPSIESSSNSEETITTEDGIDELSSPDAQSSGEVLWSLSASPLRSKAVDNLLSLNQFPTKEKVGEEDSSFSPTPVKSLSADVLEASKTAVRTLYDSIKLESGDKPSFEVLVRDAINQSNNKSGVEQMFNVFVHGWVANNYGEVDFNSAYNAIFANRADVVNSLLQLGLVSPSVTQPTEIAQNENNNLINTEKATEIVVETPQSTQESVPQTNTQIAKFVMKGHFLTLGNGTMFDGLGNEVVESMGSVGPFQTPYIDARAVVDPEGLKVDRELQVRVANEEQRTTIPITVLKNGISHKYTSFDEFVSINNIVENSPEWIENIPMVAYLDNTPTFFVHTPNYYNENTVNAPDNQAVINEARKGTIEFRNKVINNKGKLPIVITKRTQGQYKKFDISVDGTVSKPIIEVDPTSAMGFISGEGFVFFRQKGDVFVKEEAKDKFYKNAQGKNKTIVNYDVVKVNRRTGGFDLGKAINIRQGANPNQDVASDVYLQNVSQEVINLVASVVEARYLRNFGPEYSNNYMNLARQIKQTMGLDILDITGFESFMSLYMNENLVSGNMTEKEFAEKYNEPMDKTNPEKLYYTSINKNFVFTVSSKKFIGGTSKGLMLKNYEPAFVEEIPVEERGKHIAIIKRNVAEFKLSAMTTPVRLKPSKSAFEKMSNSKKANAPILGMDNEGNMINVADNYMQFLMKNSHTGMKSFNIGTASSPKFVTMVNPIVEFKVKGEGTVISNFNLSYLGYIKPTANEKKVSNKVETSATNVPLSGNLNSNTVTVNTGILEAQSETSVKELAEKVISQEFNKFVNTSQTSLFNKIEDKVGLYFSSIDEITQFMQQMTSNTKGANDLIALMNDYNNEFMETAVKIETIVSSKNLPSTFVEDYVKKTFPGNLKFNELASSFTYFVENDIVEASSEDIIVEISPAKEPSTKVESIPVELVKEVLTLGNELGLSSNSPAMQYFTELVSNSATFAPVGFNQDVLADLRDTNDNIAGLAINKSEQIIQFVNVMMGEALSKAGKSGLNKEQLVSQVRRDLLDSYITKKKNVAQRILSELSNYDNNTAEFSTAVNDLEKSFEVFQEIENDWANIETKAFNLLNKYRGIKEVAVSGKTIEVAENQLSSQEFIEELTQEPDTLSEDQISDDNIQEKNYSKMSIEESGKNTASYNLKKFFYSIENVDRNENPISGFLGLPTFVGFDKVYNTIESVLSEQRTVPSDFDAMVEILRGSVKAYPWMQQVVDKLVDPTVDQYGMLANQQIRNEFAYNFARHALAMKFTMFSKEKDGWKLKIFDTNANEINRVIEQTWRNNFKTSNLVSINLDGTYGINLEVAKDLAEKYNSFSQNAPSNQQITDFLRSFGIGISTQAVNDYINSGKNKNMFSPSEASANIVSLLGGYINRIAKLKPSTNIDFEMDKKYHPFGNANNALKRIISYEKKYATYATTNSFRDGQKSIYGFTQSKMATDVASKLKEVNSELRDRLIANPYSNPSYILDFLANDEDFRSKFDVEHLGITAMKEMGTRGSTVGNDVTSLSNADHELTKLGMFMDLEQATSNSSLNGISTRIARMFFPTMSDKSQMLMMTVPVLNINQLNFNDLNSMNMADDLFESIYDQLVSPDLNRITAFAQKKANNQDKSSRVTDIKGYDSGAQLFLTIPQLNNLVTPEGVRAIKLMQDDPSKYDTAWFKETFNMQIKSVLESQITSRVNEKIDSWKKYGFVTEKVNNNGETTVETKFLDSKYLKSFETNNMEAVKLAAINYVINSRLANANLYMMFSGDIAQYSTGKVNKFFYDGQVDKPKSVEDKGLGDDTYAYIVKEIIGVNLGKRLAELVAPGSKIANSKGDSYLQLFLKDVKSITTNTEFLVKVFYGASEVDNAKALVQRYENAKTQNEKDEISDELQRHYPDLADYFDIETTDAQEYITMKEHIDILTRQGRIDNETLNTINNKMELQARAEKEGRPIPADSMLDYFELKVLMAPIKPVYTGTIEDKKNGIERMMYIKSSSIPLIPQVTRGLELDKVRIFLETVQERSGKNVRASYESGNKIGHGVNDIALFLPDGSFNDALQTSAEMSFDNSPIANSAVVLDRDNFRIQQDVPFKSAKRHEDTISIGTQTMKLLFGDGVVNFDFNGTSGRELLNQYNKAFADIIEVKKQGLYKRLGMDKSGKPIDPNSTILKVHDLLKEEATLRGYPKQDIEALGVTQLADGTWSFEVPIWLSMNSNRYESLLNSIVTNKLAKLKMPGNAFVLASEAGFQMQSDLSNVNQSKVIYTSSWEGSLKAADIQEVDGKQVVKSAQVLLPSKFRLPNGELFNFFDKNGNPKFQYTYRDEQGILRLKEDMIDKESLLSMTSFRIPTSSHVSISQVEVVGILPTEVGDTMIVPKNLTKQKGIDFDIDKENVYQHYHFIDEDGKIRRYSASAILGVETESDAMELLTEARDIMQSYYKQKGIERGLNDLIDESEKLYEFGVEEEHSLIKNVQRLIASKKAQLDTNTVNPELVKYAKGILKVIDSPAYREKLAFNNILDIHKKVMTHPSMEEKTNKILSMDIAKSQSEFISSLVEKSTDLSDFSLTDDKYQIDKMGLGAAGKLGIGVYSNYVVFHSLVQQSSAPIQLMTQGPNGPSEFEMNLFGIPSKGILGLNRTLGNSNVSRSITEVLAERQNTATDNEKEQIMGKVNVNEVTINVDSLLVALGYDLVEYGEGKQISIPYLLLSQPIIKDYVDIMRTLRSNTSDFVSDANNEVVNRLKEKYKLSNGVTSPVSLSNVTPELMLQELSKPTGNVQLSVLSVFSDLKKQGEQMAKAQRLLNVNKDGLGKSFFEATQKFADLETFDISMGNNIRNISSLIGDFEERKGTLDDNTMLDRGYLIIGDTYIKPTTVVGHMLVNTIKVGQEFWGDLLPYNSFTLNSIFNTILENFRPGQTVSGTQKIEMKQEIFSELKKFIYSDYNFGFYEAVPNATNSIIPSQEERRRLFMDTPNSPSLATYLNTMKSVNSTDVLFTEGIEKVRDNALISRFKFNIERNLKTPSTIHFDNSKGEAFDEDHYYTAILKLIEDDLLLPNFGGQEYSTRKLGSDLLAYAFLEGGKQEATQFIKYIPMSLLKRTNFGKMVKSYNKDSIDRGLFDTLTGANLYNEGTTPFITQYFQHNPHRAYRVDRKALVPTSYENSFILAQTALDKLPEAFSSDDVNFISTYSADRTTKGGYDLFKLDKATNTFRKIDTLDRQGLNQYAMGVPAIESILGHTGNTDTVVNPILPVDAKLVKSTPDVLSSSNSEQGAINRFGISRSSMPLKTALNNMLINGNTMNMLPGLKDIMSEFTKQLTTSTQIYVSDTFVDESGNEKNLNDAGGRAVFVTNTDGTGTITISPEFYENADTQLFVKIVAHEAIHAGTQAYISQFMTGNGALRPGITEEQVPQALKDLKILLEQAREIFTEEELRSAVSRFKARKDGNTNTGLTEREVETVYGVFNLYEFASLAMTEPAFQKLLAGKKVPNSKMNFKQAFIETLKKVYSAITGIEFTPNSLLAKTLDTVLTISQQNFNQVSGNSPALFSNDKDISIEQLLSDTDLLTSSIELSDPNSESYRDDLNLEGDSDGEIVFIMAPTPFSDDLLNPKLSTNDLMSKPSC